MAPQTPHRRRVLKGYLGRGPPLKPLLRLPTSACRALTRAHNSSGTIRSSGTSTHTHSARGRIRVVRLPESGSFTLRLLFQKIRPMYISLLRIPMPFCGSLQWLSRSTPASPSHALAGAGAHLRCSADTRWPLMSGRRYARPPALNRRPICPAIWLSAREEGFHDTTAAEPLIALASVAH